MNQRQKAAVNRVRLAFWALASLMLAQTGFAQEERSELIVKGRNLFTHKWIPKDPLSPSGDGLGPLFNEVSCVACHFQGGVGGGGTNEKNVDLVSYIENQDQSENVRKRILTKVPEVHPMLRENSSAMLHRFHTNERYEPWRIRRLGLVPAPAKDVVAVAQMHEILVERQRNSGINDITVDDVPIRISRRNTPALFGAALIAAIPDEVLRQVAAAQRDGTNGVSGRLPPANPIPIPQRQNQTTTLAFEAGTRIGRFGWRGQTASLRQFVLGACAHELGLEVPDHHQPADILNKEYEAPGLDLTLEQCNQLVEFVASLPRPKQVMPVNKELAMQVEQGARIFEKVLCSNCHVKKLGTIDGLYSDLLLHDMGPDLSDPLPANPEPRDGFLGFGGYYRGSSAAPGRLAKLPPSPTLQQEWRTPPLWGVRDSAPYLHDGRAGTLEDAILLHGGEATFSVEAFRESSRYDRDRLIQFLKTLAAPDQEK